MKKNKNTLKRELKSERQKYQMAIHLKCYECMGNCADGYEDCGITDCALYPYRLKRGVLHRKSFRQEIRTDKKK